MNLKSLSLACLFLAGVFAFAQAPDAELPDPHPAAPQLWDAVKAPSFGWGSIDTRYKIDTPVPLSRSLSLYGWRGERVCAQAVLLAPAAVADFSFTVSDLKAGKHVIPASAVKGYFETFVMGEVSAQGGETVLCPDRLVERASMAVPAQTVRPVWLTIRIPSDAAPGKYKGRVSASVDGKSFSLPFTLEVSSRVLPDPKDWKFHLDLWQNPYAVARYFGVPLWSEEHFARMRPIMEYLASAGGKVITASIIQHPWNSQTEDPFESMVGKFKALDGTWTYDYSVFDKWVSFMMDCGITEQIDCYSILPWHVTFEYYDAAVGCTRTETLHPGSKAYEDYLLPFLTDFAAHLKAKGWFGKTCLAMDERPKDLLEHAYSIVRRADKDYRIEGAINYFGPEVAERMYDISFAFQQPLLTEEQLSCHLQKGNRVTFYTCCGPARPNTFINSPPFESAYLGWHAAAAGYSGYLRWAYNSWVKEPCTDARFRSWRAGDCFLVYPDGPSIRSERLIEGIQDYEKIRLLRETLPAAKTALIDAQLARLLDIDWSTASDEEVANLLDASKKLLRSF